MRALLLSLLSLLIFPAAPALAESVPAPQCVIAGCNGQLCVAADSPEMTYTCEWDAPQDCYGKFGNCARQADGSCGWGNSSELARCLQNPDTFTGTELRPRFNDNGFKGDERNPWLQP